MAEPVLLQGAARIMRTRIGRPFLEGLLRLAGNAPEDLQIVGMGIEPGQDTVTLLCTSEAFMEVSPVGWAPEEVLFFTGRLAFVPERDDRLVEGAKVALIPRAWDACVHEIDSLLASTELFPGDTLREVIAKHAGKILGEEG